MCFRLIPILIAAFAAFSTISISAVAETYHCARKCFLSDDTCFDRWKRIGENEFEIIGTPFDSDETDNLIAIRSFAMGDDVIVGQVYIIDKSSLRYQTIQYDKNGVTRTDKGRCSKEG